MTEEQINYCRLLIDDLSIYSHDTMNIVTLYLDKTGLQLPIITLLHELRHNLSVQNDRHLVAQIKQIRLDVIDYLHRRIAHTSDAVSTSNTLKQSINPALAIKNDMTEAVIGIYLTSRILAQNDFLDFASFLIPLIAQTSQNLTDPAKNQDWRSKLTQLSRALEARSKSDILELSENNLPTLLN